MLQLLVVVTVCPMISAGSPYPIFEIDLEEGWTEQTEGPWRMRYDHRELLVMRHPWEPSHGGNFASATKKVTVPSDWQGPTWIQFYCTDDYHTDEWRPKDSLPGYFSAEGFIGHRFKRLLINGEVLWDTDISDPVLVDERWPWYRFQIPVESGEEFEITLQVYDAVDSSAVLEDDFYQSGTYASRDEDPDAFNFQSHVYWGNVILFEDGTNPAPYPTWPKSPTDAKVLEIHNKRRPPLNFGDPWPDETVQLELSAPAGMPAIGFPVQTAVPIHAAKVFELDGLSLKTSRGRRIGTQKTCTGVWPDESIRWVLFDFPAKPDMKNLGLSFARDRAKLRKKSKGLSIETLRGDGVMRVSDKKKTCVEKVELGLNVSGTSIPGIAEKTTVLSDGPFRRSVRIDGRFGGAGSFRARCSTYAGLPYLKLWIQLFNDTREDLAVSAMPVRFVLPLAPETLRVPSGEVKDGFRMVQRSEKLRLLDGEEVDAVERMFLAWDDGVIAVRSFRELFPKAAYANGSVLTVDLVAAGDDPVVFTPGEAKSHEIWLALGGDIDPAQFAATVRQPPILFNSEYFCSTGVIGPAKTVEGVPALVAPWSDKNLEERRKSIGELYGVRHFPDIPHSHTGGLPDWRNNYYERMLNLWSDWFISGDRVWYDMAIDTTRHLMDVAIVHSEIPGKDWLGALHGPGNNHVAGPWSAILRTGGFDLYHKLTGDPDAMEALIGVGDFCIRSQTGVPGYSARAQAGAFDAICTAYAETGELKYLYEGTSRVTWVLRTTDWRRGTKPDEHGTKVYRGNIPWMVAQLSWPLYRWYHLSGDVRAAQALVKLAESIICEDTDWDNPGHVRGYSHNPHYPMNACYDHMIAPVLFAAYELTEDPFFLDAAIALWERGKTEGQFKVHLRWNVPWLLWYLKTYNVAPATEGSTTEEPG